VIRSGIPQRYKEKTMNKATLSSGDPRTYTPLKAVCCVVGLLSVLVMCLLPLSAVAQNQSVPGTSSLEQIKALAEKGSAEAQLKLADAYRTGKDAAQSVQDAAKWYRKAAEQGVAEAQFRLGELLIEGKGVAQNAPEAVTWLEKSGAQGFKAAQDKLAEIKSKAKDSVQDLNKALDLIR
jgi:TPR repeat protein